jgi:hypothetical protein
MVPLLAQVNSSASTATWELDWPLTAGEWSLFGLLLLAVLWTIFAAWADTRRISRIWTLWLAGLRCGALVILGLIALNPHLRVQSEAERPSQVALLIDTSTSMQQPELDPRETGGSGRTRSEAVRELLEKSPLLEELRRQHVVDVFTFDSDLSKSRARLGKLGSPASEESNTEAAGTIDWQTLLQPAGHSTNLGDALDKLLIEQRSSTLSGVVILSDGAVNAGRELRTARERAQGNGVRLVTVGVGSTQPPVNLAILKAVVPTDVQKGDLFELTAFLQGTGLEGQTVQLELLQQLEGEPEAIVVDRKEVPAAADGTAFEVVFERNPPEPGQYEFTLRARVPQVVETRLDDNLVSRRVNIFDRPLKVLMIAGGPLREYRYARTILHRHPSVSVDVWLQTGNVGISQEADRLLYRFPDTREALFQYDLLIAFDPDWKAVSPEQQDMLLDWVTNAGGGVLLVAGDVHTPTLAAEAQQFANLLKLYPVLLEEQQTRLTSREEAGTAYPVGLTQEGAAAEFLKLAESGSSGDPWNEFRGVYRCYPTRGVKAGATVYAEFTDPLSRGVGGQPVLIAAQRYGQGSILYIGSPEFWRLRATDEAYLDRFWTKLVRKVAEGRSKRGLQRGLFVLEGRDYDVGQTVPLRVRVVNPQFEPLAADQVALEVYDPQGRPQVPALTLDRDRQRPAEYIGDLRVSQPGRYRLELAVPDSTERVTAELNVQLSQLEAASLVQDVQTLTTLVAGTGGAYLPLTEAALKLPALLPDRSEITIIDEQIQEQWDRWWVLLLLAGLLSVEWLSRKLLKLA